MTLTSKAHFADISNVYLSKGLLFYSIVIGSKLE